MARPRGGGRLGGRKKGTPNKESKVLIDRIKEKYPDYCPIEAMCIIAQDPINEVNIRLTANKEVAQYIYPKLKSIDHNHGGQADNPIKSSLEVLFIKGNVDDKS